MQNEKTLAIVRLVVGLITIINLLLAARGYQPIELDEGLITTVISGIVAIGAYLWSWWKNNNVTKKAVKAQEIKNELDNDIKG
ncbi:phage holin [Macrococcus armenti]|uniref:phage holin n=1 Tax=Macrococcus armenti TaxID=2875764 RepID=UPI001CCB1071|nr:phage holin [Macrococcus armenti]UBH21556.1 phage holin [Macrococcus armenti]